MERDDIGEEQERESMFESLYEAAIKGNTDHLRNLLQNCPLVLDQVTSDSVAKDNHPLHIGAMFGHEEFVREILNRKPKLARETNSQGLSPLHLASEKGHARVVKLLLNIDADVCFLRDADGRTPLHLAAMKGRVEVLKELVGAKMIAAWILTKQREPILHICAEHRQFKALKTLVDFIREKEFVNLKDNNDNTILHILTSMGEIEVIKYLIDQNTGLEVNSINVYGSTAMDVLAESCHGKPTKKIRKLLKKAKGQLASEIFPTQQSQPDKRSQKLPPESNKKQWNEIGEGLMVVAILIATITFQAMANPPGGFWQEDGPHMLYTFYRNGSKQIMNSSHSAGTAIMAYKFPGTFNDFKTFNTIGFVASLILIILLVSRYSLKERASVWVLTLTTLIAVLSLFITYTLVSNTVDKALLPGSRREFFFSPLGDGAPLLWLFVVAFVGPLCGFLKGLPQRRRCFQLMKREIKDLFGWILMIICKLFRDERHSDFRNTGGNAGP